MELDGERRKKYRKACEAIESLSAADARLLAKIEDKVGFSLRQWPDDARTKMLASRADFKIRFCLYLFTVGNVCPPGLYVDWLIQRKMLRYVESANHMIDVIKAHKTGRLEEQGKTYWDLQAREVRTIITPTFAAEVDPSYMCKLDGTGVEVTPPGCEFWDDAIAKLEAHSLSLPREPRSF